jgi:hypothetical protein
VPSEEDLDENLKNHMEGTKDAKIVEDVSTKECSTLLLLIGQKFGKRLKYLFIIQLVTHSCGICENIKYQGCSMVSKG